MVTDKDLLNDICQNADMGRYSLQKVLERTDDARMRRSMRTQLSEYQDTYNQAKRMLYELSLIHI